MTRLLLNAMRLVLLAMALVTTVSADTVFSNLPASAPYYGDSGLAVEGSQSGNPSQAVAVGFVSSDLYKLDSLTLLLATTRAPVYAGPIDLYLMTDDKGLPGRVIDSWNVAAENVPWWEHYATPVTIMADRNIVLHPDAQYWVAAFPGSTDAYVGWFLPPLPLDEGPVLISRGSDTPDGASWFTRATSGTVVARPGLAVIGTPVPEPSSLLLLGTGLAGLYGAARKKVRR